MVELALQCSIANWHGGRLATEVDHHASRPECAQFLILGAIFGSCKHKYKPGKIKIGPARDPEPAGAGRR